MQKAPKGSAKAQRAEQLNIAEHGDALAREQSLEEALGFTQAIIGEDDRLCSARWVRDVSLLMETVERVPIMALPSSVFVMQPKQ